MGNASSLPRIFSEEKRIGHFRELWIALAESESELGLNINKEQINELKENLQYWELQLKEKKKPLTFEILLPI